MCNVKIISGSNVSNITAEYNTKLNEILINGNFPVDHHCGCIGKCKKCIVSVDGKSVLSCQYRIKSDITVEIPQKNDLILPDIITNENERIICLDIGTTTLEFALISPNGNKITKNFIADNPQKIFGADVISRIAYCTNNGTKKLNQVLIDVINNLTSSFVGNKTVDKMYVSGNTTMLHIFLNIDCSSMGVAPYKPVFTDGKTFFGEQLGLKNIKKVETLPCISSFIGADIVSGLIAVEKPMNNKYNLLIDLGTNAEIVLFSNNKYICTSAAAGPCFEGVNISCGMTAKQGAICTYNYDNTYSVIGNAKPNGICATGLIDLIAVLLKKNVIDSSGNMRFKKFDIAPDVSLFQSDIRQFQLAKSAIYSAVSVLMEKAKVDYSEIDSVFVAGGFSEKLNIDNAVQVGLFSDELKDKIQTVNNSSINGLIKYATKQIDFQNIIYNSQYIDLSSDLQFSELFIKNMMFR